MCHRKGLIMGEIETKYTHYATCPWCGYENMDSWELDDGEYDCPSCEKPIVVVRDVCVTYLTYKGEEGKD